jgi:prephenate dehydrogenase
MPKPHFKTTVLIGVGLIGGSLARDLLRLKMTDEVVGFDLSRRELANAKKIKAITSVGRDLMASLAKADLIIFAVPVRALRQMIADHGIYFSPQALAIDVGSTKAAIVAEASRRVPHGNFVGCHPMAGREKSGVAASCEGLFANKQCFLSPGLTTKPKFVKKAAALWRSLGAKPILLDAKKHDRILSWISHLPHAVASALVSSLVSEFKRYPETRKFTAGGFLDTTRIAAGPAEMWKEICMVNRDELRRALDGLIEELGVARQMLENKDEVSLLAFLRRAKNLREEMKFRQ